MKKRTKPAIRHQHRHLGDLRLAVDHVPPQSFGWPLGSVIILFALAAIVGGVVIARSRIPARAEFSAHDPGPLFIPGTGVRFGEDQPAHIESNEIGEVIDPDRTEEPPPAAPDERTARGADQAGGGGDADAE